MSHCLARKRWIENIQIANIATPQPIFRRFVADWKCVIVINLWNSPDSPNTGNCCPNYWNTNNPTAVQIADSWLKTGSKQNRECRIRLASLPIATGMNPPNCSTGGLVSKSTIDGQTGSQKKLRHFPQIMILQNLIAQQLVLIFFLLRGHLSTSRKSHTQCAKRDKTTTFCRQYQKSAKLAGDVPVTKYRQPKSNFTATSDSRKSNGKTVITNKKWCKWKNNRRFQQIFSAEVYGEDRLWQPHSRFI